MTQTATALSTVVEERVDEESRDVVAWRVRRAATCALLFALAFLQSPGRVAPDTKLDLTADPGFFLARALQMWDGSGFAGQLQNQAYGYLFPIGPFFWVGDAVGIPEWVVQRLWWGTVLTVAFLGMTTLARRLGIGSPASQLIAGLAFALAPRMVSALGPVSAEVWPMAVAPWVLVPLVRATGRNEDYRRPALRSAFAVALMGGVNASLTLAAVVPAVLFLLTRAARARSVKLALWWVVSVVVATAWWVVPLLLLGGYSPPFLDYIESASVTTLPTSLVETLRGTSHWVAFLGPRLGSPWRAGFDLVSQPTLIINTAVVAAVGLAGLCLPALRERLWLVLSLIVGVVMVTLGHVGALSSPFAEAERELLDGVLAPLRNVHKFDVPIRIALALGLAHALHLVPRLVWGLRQHRTAVVGLGTAVLVAVVGLAAPAFAMRMAPDGTYLDIPPYWKQAATWLQEHPRGRVLLAPGARFAVFGWGSTLDEPLQSLSSRPWDVRNAIPLVPAGHIRMQDTIESVFASGRPSNGLAEYLARNGYSYLLVRNDLDEDRAQAPRRSLVRQVLEGSPGLRKVAEYGPRVGLPELGGVVIDEARDVATYRAIEIWAVTPPPKLTRVTALRDVSEVVGGPESLLNIADADLLRETATVLSADLPSRLVPPRVVVTDGLRKREVNFGLTRDSASQTLTDADRGTLGRRLLDYTISSEPSVLTTGVWEGVRNVTVSSSKADPGATRGGQPYRSAAAAFDGRRDTAWIADSESDPTPSLRLRLSSPTALREISFRLPQGSASGIATVLITTDDERFDVPVDSADVYTARLEGDPTRSVTLQILPKEGSTVPLGLTEVTIPGVNVSYLLRTPEAQIGGRSAAIVLNAAPGGRTGCVGSVYAPYCSAQVVRMGEEQAGLEREVPLRGMGAFRFSGTVVPAPGRSLDALIAEETGLPVRATASSSSVAAPLAGPLAAVDGRTGTSWVAGPDDPEPTLELSWDEPQTLSRLRLDLDEDMIASRPTRVVVEVGGARFEAPVERDGDVRFPAIESDRLRLSITAVDQRVGFSPYTKQWSVLPAGISEVVVAMEEQVPLPDLDTPFQSACGTGPLLTIDGQERETAVLGSVEDLLRVAPMRTVLCEDEPIVLGSGTHRISFPTTRLWRADSVVLVEPTWTEPSTAGVVTQNEEWTDDKRRIELGTRDEAVLLEVIENENRGWTGHVADRPLDKVRVDGWKQGYVVPAGDAAQAHLVFGPAESYRAALAVGAGLLGLVALGALLMPRDRSPRVAGPARWPDSLLAMISVLALFELAGVVGAVVAGSLVVVWLVARRRAAGSRHIRSAWAVCAAGLFLAAGAGLAASPWGTPGYSSWMGVIQLLSAGAVAMVCVAMLSDSLSVRKARRNDSH